MCCKRERLRKKVLTQFKGLGIKSLIADEKHLGKS
jgi:hypothetical protein